MTVEIICADARDALAAMPDGSVHACITSPPYWGLRDYGLEPGMWGDAECAHEWAEMSYQRRSNDGGDADRKQETNAGALGRGEPVHHAFCWRCNAWRGSLGLEPTPELYVEHIVQVMREIRRVLRDDGTLWLNLGDSYAGSQKGIGADGTAYGGAKQRTNAGSMGLPVIKDIPGLKPKDLCGMPWRVAFALQADGWWLREEVIWYKKNPMPESVNDRCTRSHEQVFRLSKSARYYADQDAIREPSIGQNHHDLTGPGYQAPGQTRQTGSRNGPASHKGSHFDKGKTAEHQLGRASSAPRQDNPAGRNKRSVWEIATQPFGMEMCSACKMVYDAARYRRLRSGGAPRCQFEVAEDEKCGGSKFELLDGRWQCIACDTTYTVKGLQRLPRAARCACGRDDAWIGHFAVFPEKLVEPCILAGTSERGCCPECGAPWERVVEAQGGTIGRSWHDHKDDVSRGQRVENAAKGRHGYRRVDRGWRPTCDHDAEPAPCTVMDPFAGSGTVGLVAERLGRHSVLIDVSEDYCRMARERTAQMGLFAH
jgi:DNA modification methylase